MINCSELNGVYAPLQKKSVHVLISKWFRWFKKKKKKTPPANAGDMGSVPSLGGCPGEGNGNPFQYSCLRNPMDRGAWWATVHGDAKELDTT